LDADAGLMPVQLRFATGLTGADYVTREGWREARLTRCPLHVHGGCGFAGHGSYERKRPAGTLIRRWYCPLGHCTFSLLPDHLAARFPGTLAEIEHVVATVEQASSVEAAANELRRDAITLPSALRWVRRRLALVRPLLSAVVSLLPQWLLGCAARIGALRERLGGEPVLMRLRERLAVHLQALSRPLGFGYRGGEGAPGGIGFQQHMGPDPPRRGR
jgi:hypothetical protein